MYDLYLLAGAVTFIVRCNKLYHSFIDEYAPLRTAILAVLMLDAYNLYSPYRCTPY